MSASTSTSTSLSLRALLKRAAARAGISADAAAIAGLSAPARALLAALTAREAPVMLVVPADGDVDRAVADISVFLSVLEGLTDADADAAVLPFPSPEVDPYRGLAPHFDVSSARARALHALASRAARVVVASAAALLPRLTSPARLLARARVLAPGDELTPPDLAELLADAGFAREDPVDEPGEFCVRGGVADFFPASERHPIRVEFLGDTIESLRRYDPSTQRSIATLDRAVIVPLTELPDTALPGTPDRPATIVDYVRTRGGLRLLVSEPDEVRAVLARQAEHLLRSYRETSAGAEPGAALRPDPSTLAASPAILDPWLATAIRLDELLVEGAAPSIRHVACQPVLEFAGRFADWIAEVRRCRDRGDTVLFVAATSGRAERTVELLREYQVPAAPVERAGEAPEGAVLVAVGGLSRGFRLQAAALTIFTEPDVFEEERRVHQRRRALAGAFLSDFRDLKAGDLIVHVDHGIGLFVGLRQIDVGHDAQEFMELRYAGQDKLFVPVERLDLVQKYTGASRPALDRLGGTSWERAKTRVRKAMRDMAEELLRLYAARKSIQGHAFSPDSHWQREFEDAFEYELTPDQQAAVADIKQDLEAPAPMDRLLCGDVGYGKTEVALRAAFKAVMDGKQVAFLAPTTVLAFQHLKTLQGRFAAFPVTIDMISRFRTRPEQKAVLAALASGRVDIIVGTHRLLSKDVVFRDLGLLVVDEEQRFGVVHKERLKQLRKRIDVLTMTATPIPRTLNMSLVGIRDMSIIETPPKDRLAVQTSIVRFDSEVIRRAIRNELERGGQVFFVHNRVESIFSVASLVTRLVPEARLAVAHGRMNEADLEKVMVDFVAHRYDVLVSTTIIENGLDIPNANTLIVNRADRYGLAQLYQLRGRVGRSDRRAYACLLIPPEEGLSPVARKRLAAIREFSDLGSGFRVAALDLEIRGAGNLLGGEQSGHIETVGFDLYMKLLEQAVRELKGEELEDAPRATVNLRVDLRIDEGYIAGTNQRLFVYRRIAAGRSEEEIGRVIEELRDRYGPVPDTVLNLAEHARIRVLADRLGIQAIDREGDVVVFRFREGAKVDVEALAALVRSREDLTLIPPATLRMDIRGATALADSPRRGSRGGDGRRAGRAAVSWWTARATAGAVAPGFSKAEALKPASEDPKAPGGVFSRVSDLLSGLRGTK